MKLNVDFSALYAAVEKMGAAPVDFNLDVTESGREQLQEGSEIKLDVSVRCGEARTVSITNLEE